MNDCTTEEVIHPKAPAFLEQNLNCTRVLDQRSTRPPDYQLESSLLVSLSQSLASDPERLLQHLVEATLRLPAVDSACISIEETHQGQVGIRCRALSGELATAIHGNVPRDFVPRGLALTTHVPLLVGRSGSLDRFLSALYAPSKLGKMTHEVLLVPIVRNARPIGALWAISHSEEKTFEKEDLRILESLSTFTSAAYQATEARNESETESLRLNKIFDHMPSAIAMVNGPEHRYTYANSAYLVPLSGDKNIIGKTVTEVLPEAIEQGFLSILDEVFRTGERFVGSEVRFDFREPNGDTRTSYFTLVFEPVRDPQNRVEGILAAIEDVTMSVTLRKKAEEDAKTLATEKSKLESIFAVSSVGIGLMAGKDLIFEAVNERLKQFVSEREYIGRKWSDVYPELAKTPLRKIILEVLETGKRYESSEMELELETKPGLFEKRRFDFSYERILDGTGKPYGVVLECMDSTARVRARENLKTTALDLIDTLESMSDAFFSLDRNWKVTSVNGQMVTKTQYSREELLGANFLDLFFPSLEQKKSIYWTQYHKAMTERIAVQFEDYYAPLDLWTQVRVYPKSDGGISVFFSDVGIQKTAEMELKAASLEAERANQLKSAFLANMSHEIRTPLGAMIGFADLLRDPTLTEKERKSYVDILVRNGEQLTMLINDILDLSKVESGHLALEYMPTDVNQIGSDIVSLMRVKAREKNLALEYSADPSTPDSIISDPTRVRQIMLNLVGNAIKFTRAGSVTIRSFGCKSDKGQDSVCFEVSDTGIGMSKNQTERLFQTFSQADETTTRKFGGTGLGLVLSRRLACELGGDIVLKSSQENRGSTFLVTIPDSPEKLISPEAFKKREDKQVSSVKGLRLDGIRVLVVDDAPDNRQLIRRYLDKQGALVELAENGLEGLEATLAGDFDIVLMDIQMPIMDGYTATQKLREAGYTKPIIALTAHAMNEIRIKALNVGYTDHLTKPINASELISAIVSHVS